MNKTISEEKKLKMEKLEKYQELLLKAEDRLNTMKRLCSEKPWDAELDHEKNELEHQIEVIKFNIKQLEEELSK